MDAVTILHLGAVMLALGCLGLLLVRSNNPRLRGLGWLAGAFGVGCVGAILLTLPGGDDVFTIIGADISVLLALALLHVAVMEMMTGYHAFSWVSAVILAVMLVEDLLVLRGLSNGIHRGAIISLLVALQCSLTAELLWRTSSGPERPPAMFCSHILTLFAIFNVGRTALVLSPLLYRWKWPLVAGGGTYAVYISTALGLAFGFFWMSTTHLSLQLERIAGTDPLTRLYNRRTFLDACSKEFESASPSERPFSILMLDLDHFKNINDRFGHSAGDTALVAAVAAMQNSIRGSDILARWGGEEFAALLPNATLDAAHVVAERIRANVEKTDIALEGGQGGHGGDRRVQLTISIGLASWQPGEDIHGVMRRADQSLYMAKSRGRNLVLCSTVLAGELEAAGTLSGTA